MVSLYLMYYNFGRVHQTLRVTPAMEAGSLTMSGASRKLSARLNERRGKL
jgi:hypothetical protein